MSFLYAAIQTAVGVALSLYWMSFFEGIYRQSTLRRVEQLYRLDVENLNNLSEIPLKTKQKMYRRMRRLWRVANYHHTGEVSHRTKEIEGRYVLNPYPKRWKQGAEPRYHGVTPILPVQMTLSLSWWAFGLQHVEHLLTGMVMVMGVAMVYGVGHGRRFRAKRRTRNIRLSAMLSWNEQEMLHHFEQATKAYRMEGDLLSFPVGRQRGGRTERMEMRRLSKQAWERSGQDHAPHVERLLQTLVAIKGWEREVLFGNGGKERTELPFRSMFESLCGQASKNRYTREFSKQLWENSPAEMSKAVDLMHELRAALNAIMPPQTSKEKPLPSTTHGEGPLRFLEEERLRRMMDVVQEVRDKKGVDEEVKEMAARTWVEMEERLMETRLRIREGQQEWQDMKDFSTLQSIRSEVGVEMLPTEKMEWEQELARRFSLRVEANLPKKETEG